MAQIFSPQEIAAIAPGTWVEFRCPVEGCGSTHKHKWLVGGNAKFALSKCWKHFPAIEQTLIRILGETP